MERNQGQGTGSPNRQSPKDTDKKDIGDEEMTIKIQTMDSAFHWTLNKNSTIVEWKEKIASQYKIPIINQRLIYQGRLMKDTDTLVNVKITNDCVIHLVARALEEMESNQNTNNLTLSQEQQAEANNVAPLHPSPHNRQYLQHEEILPGIQIPFRSNRRRRRLAMPHYDISECFETLYQNVLSWDNFQKCKKEFPGGSHRKDKTTNTANPGTNGHELFDFNKTTYEVGQWVDVKDTIEQWLEAQVIQVNDNKAYVHYNGWGTRWDEWIDFTSPRIRNFKVYTMQSPGSFFMCPYPGIPCDSNIEPQSRSIDSFYYLEKCREYMQKIINDIDKMIALRRKEGRKEIFKDNKLNENDDEIMHITGQWVPLLDRCGRMMSDLSTQFSHLIVNPNYYPQMWWGYKRADVLKELKMINELNEKKCQQNVNDQLNTSGNLSEKINNDNKEVDKDKDRQNMKTVNTTSDEIIDNNNNSSNQSTITQNENTNNTNGNDVPQRSQTTTTSANIGTRTTRQRPSSPSNSQNLSNIATQVSPTLIQTNLGYNLSKSSSELPFIERIISSYTPSDRIVSPNSHVASLNSHKTLFPQLNLQVPSLLSSGEVLMMTGYSPFSEPNFDIYVHTIVTNPNQQRSQPQVNTDANDNIVNTDNSQGRNNHSSMNHSSNFGNQSEPTPQISQRVVEGWELSNGIELNQSMLNTNEMRWNGTSSGNPFKSGDIWYKDQWTQT